MIWGIIFAASAVVAMFFRLFYRLIVRFRMEARQAEPDGFLTDDYAPMRRLLRRKDFQFLTAHPGYRPEIVRRLRLEHRGVLAVYLRSASRDFHRLHALAKEMLIHSPVDQPDFAEALRKQHRTFYYAVTMVRCQLLLMPFGVKAPDIGKLVRSLESLRVHLKSVLKPERLPADSL